MMKKRDSQQSFSEALRRFERATGRRAFRGYDPRGMSKRRACPHCGREL